MGTITSPQRVGSAYLASFPLFTPFQPTSIACLGFCNCLLMGLFVPALIPISAVLHPAEQASGAQVPKCCPFLRPSVDSDIPQGKLLTLAYKHSHVWLPLPLCSSLLCFGSSFTLLFPTCLLGTHEHSQGLCTCCSLNPECISPEINMASSFLFNCYLP